MVLRLYTRWPPRLQHRLFVYCKMRTAKRNNTCLASNGWKAPPSPAGTGRSLPHGWRRCSAGWRTTVQAECDVYQSIVTAAPSSVLSAKRCVSATLLSRCPSAPPSTISTGRRASSLVQVPFRTTQKEQVHCSRSHIHTLHSTSNSILRIAKMVQSSVLGFPRIVSLPTRLARAGAGQAGTA